jgi:hypothetical protein
MPKAKWGAGDAPLTADAIDGAERQETQKRYSGPMPRAGTYRFVIKSLKQGVSNTGNDKVMVTAILDGTWMENHKEYDGCPIWDHLPIMDSTKERVANFLDAIGATGDDLMNKALVDELGYITKLGAVGDPAGIIVYINVERSKPTKEYPDVSLKVGFNGYIPVDDDESGAAATADGDEPPF